MELGKMGGENPVVTWEEFSNLKLCDSQTTHANWVYVLLQAKLMAHASIIRLINDIKS